MFDRERLADYQKRVSRITAATILPLFVLALLTELYRADWSLSTVALAPETPLLIARNMLPGLLAVGGAFFLAANFVVVMYSLRNYREGADHLRRSIFGQPGKKPILIVSQGKIMGDENSLFARVGGPVRLLIHRDSAVLLERGGHLTRVLGPSKIDYLQSYERVREVIDLRPMRWGDYKVEALSKEGIPVEIEADVSFQIDTKGQEPSNESPFPARPDAVFKAAISKWVRSRDKSEDDRYFDWVRRVVISEMEGALRGIVARYPMDRLVGLESPAAPGIPHPRRAIRDELSGKLKTSTAKLGVEINDVQIGTIKAADKVTQQWIDVWKESQQNKALLEKETGKARGAHTRESARIQAQVEMITSMAAAIQKSAAKDNRISSRILIMRIIEALEHHSISPYTYLPGQALDTLTRLRQLLG